MRPADLPQAPDASSEGSPSGGGRRWQVWIDGLAYSLGALMVLWIFLSSPGINHHSPSALGPMVYGRAARPFVSRALVPGIVRALQSLVPDGLRAHLESEAGHPPLSTILVQLDRIPDNLTVEFLTACVVMYGILVGFLVALRGLWDEVFDAPEAVKRAVPLFALCLLPSLFRFMNYVYDFATLLFFTLGLLLLRRRQWGGFLAVFALSCFNKETTILLTLVMCIEYAGSRGSRGYRGLVAIQLAVFAASRAILYLAFHRNPGSDLEYHLVDHNLRLLKAYPLTSVMAWVLIAALVVLDWRNKPRLLRNSLWMLVPLLSLATVFGYLDELRAFYEVFPTMVLLMAYSLVRLAGAQIATRTEGELPLAAT